MKKIIGLSVILAVVMLLAPISALDLPPKVPTVTTVEGAEKQPESEKAVAEYFKVYSPETQKITEMTADDYIFGVVAAEMPALYNEEALKAQAVAAYTYACVRKANNSGQDYDITTDYNVDQSFVTESDLKEKWGDKTQEYVAKIKKAVKDVRGYMITYDGKAITAVYHAISSGKTENAENVWSKGLPYLKSVESSGDKEAENYKTEVTLTLEELKEKLKPEFEIKKGDDIVFEILEVTDAGTVKKLKIAGFECSGAALRNLLDLRSACFSVEKTDTGYTFTVYGYGHGVGMSQTGANYMAERGSDFKEILTHYYTGCKVEKVIK